MVAMSLVVNSDRGVHTSEIDMGERIAALGLSVSCADYEYSAGLADCLYRVTSITPQ